MSIDKLLLWEKWRPKNIDDIILLPRIKKYFDNGINGNYIFYGHYGTGKTSLARILVGRYHKNTPYLEINSSIATSINVLRNEIEDFCKFTPMMESDSDIKFIFLDEFDRTSAEFQDAFKAFIEKYNKSVRFIITTNHINKVSDGIKSRIPQINFDCENKEEEKFLKQEIFKRINNIILPGEGKEIPKSDLISIINRGFPDFRSIMISVQDYLQTGTVDVSSTISNSSKLDLYNLILDSSKTYEDVYHYLMSNFGADKIHIMITFLGKSFIDFIITNNPKLSDRLFECNYVITDYSDKLNTNTDPIVLGMTIIGKLKDILLAK